MQQAGTDGTNQPWWVDRPWKPPPPFSLLLSLCARAEHTQLTLPTATAFDAPRARVCYPSVDSPPQRHLGPPRAPRHTRQDVSQTRPSPTRPSFASLTFFDHPNDDNFFSPDGVAPSSGLSTGTLLIKRLAKTQSLYVRDENEHVAPRVSCWMTRVWLVELSCASRPY